MHMCVHACAHVSVHVRGSKCVCNPPNYMAANFRSSAGPAHKRSPQQGLLTVDLPSVKEEMRRRSRDLTRVSSHSSRPIVCNSALAAHGLEVFGKSYIRKGRRHPLHSHGEAITLGAFQSSMATASRSPMLQTMSP